MVPAIKQRAFLVEHVFRNGGKCIDTVQKRFFTQLPDAEAPHHRRSQGGGAKGYGPPEFLVKLRNSIKKTKL